MRLELKASRRRYQERKTTDLRTSPHAQSVSPLLLPTSFRASETIMMRTERNSRYVPLSESRLFDVLVLVLLSFQPVSTLAI